MLAELIVHAVLWVFGSVQGLGTAVALLVAAHYLSKGTAIAIVFQNLKWFGVLLAALTVTGAVDVHPDVLVGLAKAGLSILMGLL